MVDLFLDITGAIFTIVVAMYEPDELRLGRGSSIAIYVEPDSLTLLYRKLVGISEYLLLSHRVFPLGH